MTDKVAITLLMLALCGELTAPAATNRVKVAAAPALAVSGCQSSEPAPSAAALPPASIAPTPAIPPCTGVRGLQPTPTPVALPQAGVRGAPSAPSLPAPAADTLEPASLAPASPSSSADALLMLSLCGEPTAASADSLLMLALAPASPFALAAASLPASVRATLPALSAPAFSRFDLIEPAPFSVMWLIREQAKAAESRGESTDALWLRYWQTYRRFLRQDAIGGRRLRGGGPQRPRPSTSPSNP